MKRSTIALFLLMAFPLFSVGQTFTITASDNNHISLHFELDDFRPNGLFRNSLSKAL